MLEIIPRGGDADGTAFAAVSLLAHRLPSEFALPGIGLVLTVTNRAQGS
jgi:hypothetical protein